MESLAERFDREIGWAGIYPPGNDFAEGKEFPQVVWDAYHEIGVLLEAVPPGIPLWEGGPVRSRWSIIANDDAYTQLCNEVNRQLGRDDDDLPDKLAGAVWEFVQAVAHACDQELEALLRKREQH